MLRCGYSFHSTLPKKLCALRHEYGAFGDVFGFLMLHFGWPNTVPKNGWDFFLGMEEVSCKQGGERDFCPIPYTSKYMELKGAIRLAQSSQAD